MKKKPKFFYTCHLIIKQVSEDEGVVVLNAKGSPKHIVVNELLDLINEYGNNEVFDKFIKKIVNEQKRS